MPGGRPTDYNQETCDNICDRLVEGQSLRTITNDPSMPSAKTVFRWMRLHEEFRKQYEVAKQLQMDYYAEEMMDIADDGSNDYMENAKGDEVYNGEAVQRSRLRVDTRKWIAERLKPKRYGAKTEVEHSGAINVMPKIVKDGKEVTFDIGTTKVTGSSTEDSTDS